MQLEAVSERLEEQDGLTSAQVTDQSESSNLTNQSCLLAP
jgi:hypothetical protein